MERLDELVLEHQSCCKWRHSTSYLLGATYLIGGAVAGGGGGGATTAAAKGGGGGASTPISGAS